MSRAFEAVRVGALVTILGACACVSRANPDAARDDVVAAEEDVGPIECGAQICAPGEQCVHRVTAGIPTIGRDGGSCPDGTVPDPTFDSCRPQQESIECSLLPVRCGELLCDGRDAASADGCSCGTMGSTLWCTCSAY